MPQNIRLYSITGRKGGIVRKHQTKARLKPSGEKPKSSISASSIKSFRLKGLEALLQLPCLQHASLLGTGSPCFRQTSLAEMALVSPNILGSLPQHRLYKVHNFTQWPLRGFVLATCCLASGTEITSLACQLD